MNLIKYKKMMKLRCVCFAISAISFLLIPFSNFEGTRFQTFLAYMVGALFWFGLITGIIITFRVGNLRKKAGFKEYRFPGIINFFKNKLASICDFTMIACFILFLILQNFIGLYSMITLFFLTIVYFLICLHFVLNGNNYLYCNNHQEVIK